MSDTRHALIPLALSPPALECEFLISVYMNLKRQLMAEYAVQADFEVAVEFAVGAIKAEETILIRRTALLESYLNLRNGGHSRGEAAAVLRRLYHPNTTSSPPVVWVSRLGRMSRCAQRDAREAFRAVVRATHSDVASQRFAFWTQGLDSDELLADGIEAKARGAGGVDELVALACVVERCGAGQPISLPPLDRIRYLRRAVSELAAELAALRSTPLAHCRHEALGPNGELKPFWQEPLVAERALALLLAKSKLQHLETQLLRLELEDPKTIQGLLKELT